jgi:hypothetical protein
MAGIFIRPHAESGWFTKAVHAVQATTNAQRARELATTGAVITPEFPTITPHDLRHTAASLAVSAGANVKVVQRILGHKSATMTLDIYAGLFDDDLESGRPSWTRRVQQVCSKCAHGRDRPVAIHCEPVHKTAFELRVQTTRRATSTIAEVICAISSGVQMNGGIA